MSDVFTNLKVFPLKDKGNLKGHGTVTIGGHVEVRFTVLEGKNGIFAGLPGRKGTKPGEDGKIPWYADVKIPDEELRNEFQKLVRAEFKKALGQGSNSSAGEDSQVPPDGVPF